VQSLQQLAPTGVDWAALRAHYAGTAHRSHKDWPTTEQAAATLAEILGGPDDAAFRRIFERVLGDGNFDGAASAAAARPASWKPWIVLVTGLNGIRKTTSVQQPWFKEALHEALSDQFAGDAAELPDGGDSFFRQLDYMIATLALTEFRRLYTVEEVGAYAAVKDSIFARYRTAAEMLGVLLIKDAQRRRMNIMVETSGRDIGMYEYIEHLFPGDSYRKLAVNFEVNDIGFAERSVDARMEREMRDGRAALALADPMAVVRANAGGPYGSAVLAGVQADSQQVWRTVVGGGEGDLGHSWYKASLVVTADAAKPWTVRAAGGSRTFEFGPPPGGAESVAK